MPKSIEEREEVFFEWDFGSQISMIEVVLIETSLMLHARKTEVLDGMLYYVTMKIILYLQIYSSY